MSRLVCEFTIEDALHIPPEQRAAIIAAYPAHEREARVNGVPTMGSGRVFTVTEESIVVDPFPAPSHFAQINGLDFGWDHPFAGVNEWWDRESDTVFVAHEYAISEQTPIVHAAAIKAWGAWIPNAWPHDGHRHENGTGIALRSQYVSAGLNMLPAHATFPAGGYSVEAGVMEMLDRMKTGRFKVFRSCTGWLSEFRLYHRKNGKIEKIRDDRISASRYGLMMLRHAITKPNPRPRGEFHGQGTWMR